MKQITKVSPDPGQKEFEVVNMDQEDIYIHSKEIPLVKNVRFLLYPDYLSDGIAEGYRNSIEVNLDFYDSEGVMLNWDDIFIVFSHKLLKKKNYNYVRENSLVPYTGYEYMEAKYIDDISIITPMSDNITINYTLFDMSETPDILNSITEDWVTTFGAHGMKADMNIRLYNDSISTIRFNPYEESIYPKMVLRKSTLDIFFVCPGLIETN